MISDVEESIIKQSYLSERITHTIENVGDKLRNFYENEMEKTLYKHELDSISLSEGYPGICIFFQKLKSLNNKENDIDLIIYELIQRNLSNLEATNSVSSSLWSGLTATAVAIKIIAKNDHNYKTLSLQLDDLLLNNLDEKIRTAEDNLRNKNIRMQDYDVIEGLTGIGRYLLMCKKDKKAKVMLEKILKYLVNLSKIDSIDNVSMPNWHINMHNQFLEEDKNLYPNGNFNLGISHGIAGPLSLLSRCLNYNIEVKGQREAIHNICSWYIKYKKEDKFGPYWPLRLSLEEIAQDNISKSVRNYEAWCYGIPGVARALWLAGESLHEPTYSEVAVQAFSGMVNRPQKDQNIASPTFCHGRAGLLYCFYRMYLSTGNESFKHTVVQMIKETIEFFDENEFFGFYDLDKKEKKANPGILTGAAGIALVLLSILKPSTDDWGLIFLIE
ncbi:lanthionine synthetase C family protein [Priestia flexa]|uniref:lanthionine synthetase C family protein n=1 Tax=Priestia flexa TaxID=86664 RepID=UPI0024914C2F|nr:lanthionine synthetase C family protein [Priestia flexa]